MNSNSWKKGTLHVFVNRAYNLPIFTGIKKRVKKSCNGNREKKKKGINKHNRTINHRSKSIVFQSIAHFYWHQTKESKKILKWKQTERREKIV